MGSGASTIVQTACKTHKPRRAAVALAVISITLLPSTSWAQTVTVREPVGRSQVLSVAASGVVFLIPRTLNIREGPPGCAPCARGAIPGYDRWALTSLDHGWSAASSVALGGLAAVTWFDMARGRGKQGLSEWSASVESVSWALATTEIFKAALARNRPILYTGDAVDVADVTDSRRSLPSGHASAAFALATSYAIAQWRRGNKLPGWLAMAAAGGVGAMRVIAGRHFPSDVVAGAALGTASAVVIQTIRF